VIKVFISMNKLKGGPFVFRKRLVDFLKKSNEIIVVDNINKKFDIELCFIRDTMFHNRPKIIRIDGCYYIDRLNFNVDIKRSIKKSRHVIYQSSFSKKMCESILGIDKPSSVVHNGIDIEYVQSINPDENVKQGSFVACSNLWRNTKRPKSIVKGFLAANTGRHLYIIGDGFKEKINSPFIHCLGYQDNYKTISIMKSCQYLIHLCHIDSCPNTVIEGLVCGLNVLCTNLGGSQELVQNDGVILQIDKWKNRVIGKCNLDTLDPDVVANGISKLMLISNRPNRNDLDIKLVANKYIDIIKRVINQI